MTGTPSLPSRRVWSHRDFMSMKPQEQLDFAAQGLGMRYPSRFFVADQKLVELDPATGRAEPVTADRVWALASLSLPLCDSPGFKTLPREFGVLLVETAAEFFPAHQPT